MGRTQCKACENREACGLNGSNDINDAVTQSTGIETTSPADDQKYPLLVRVYGIISIIAGGLQIAVFVLVLLMLLLGDIDYSRISATEHIAITTVVVAIVAVVVSLVLAAMFVALGIRLIRGKRHRAATLVHIMIALEAVVIITQMMLTGFSSNLIMPFVNMVILIALEAYSDPSLRDERRLQRHLLSLERKAEAEDGTLGRDASGKGYIALNFFNIFWVFVVCCILGLVFEVIWHMIVVEPGVYQDRAGLLYGPFSPIYGCGAVLMTIALNHFHDKNPILIFLVSAVIGGAFEFFVSWFMEMAFGIVAWDYTGTWLSIDGRTNGFFMIIWGILGLLWVKFALPIMLKVVNKIPWNWRYGVTAVCAALMIVDAGLTLASFDCWFQREGGTMDYDNASAIVQFCNENYDNDFMVERFQSMTINPENAARV